MVDILCTYIYIYKWFPAQSLLVKTPPPSSPYVSILRTFLFSKDLQGIFSASCRTGEYSWVISGYVCAWCPDHTCRARVSHGLPSPGCLGAGPGKTSPARESQGPRVKYSQGRLQTTKRITFVCLLKTSVSVTGRRAPGLVARVLRGSWSTCSYSGLCFQEEQRWC